MNEWTRFHETFHSWWRCRKSCQHFLKSIVICAQTDIYCHSKLQDDNAAALQTNLEKTDKMLLTLNTAEYVALNHLYYLFTSLQICKVVIVEVCAWLSYFSAKIMMLSSVQSTSSVHIKTVYSCSFTSLWHTPTHPHMVHSLWHWTPCA